MVSSALLLLMCISACSCLFLPAKNCKKPPFLFADDDDGPSSKSLLCCSATYCFIYFIFRWRVLFFFFSWLSVSNSSSPLFNHKHLSAKTLSSRKQILSHIGMRSGSGDEKAPEKIGSKMFGSRWLAAFPFVVRSVCNVTVSEADTEMFITVLK